MSLQMVSVLQIQLVGLFFGGELVLLEGGWPQNFIWPLCGIDFYFFNREVKQKHEVWELL